MNSAPRALFLLFLVPLPVGFLTAGAAAAADDEPYSAERCVEIALTSSPEVEEAESQVRLYQARLAEVESVYYPKLFGMAFVAPMFSVDFNISSRDVERRWRSIGDWGPYTRLQATLAQPLYTFGRAEACEEASRHRLELEWARLRETKNSVALEVRKMHTMHLYALSMLPTLRYAAEAVDEALTTATESYDSGESDVTLPDLMKLSYAATEIEKAQAQATSGAALALEALAHTMGLPRNTELTLAAKKLPKPPAEPPVDLALLVAEAAKNRPEWAQLAHGEAAAKAWEDAEQLANAPLLFLAGMFEASWTPTRASTDNPYHADPYNDMFGGIALGLMFDLDPWLAAAKAEGARATQAQVAALERFAKTGIPLQVRNGYDDLRLRHKQAGLSAKGVKYTRKWQVFAAAAYIAGTGEARDLFEGLAAYVGAKNSYYENLRDYQIAAAELDYALGRPTQPTE